MYLHHKLLEPDASSQPVFLWGKLSNRRISHRKINNRKVYLWLGKRRDPDQLGNWKGIHKIKPFLENMKGGCQGKGNWKIVNDVMTYVVIGESGLGEFPKLHTLPTSSLLSHLTAEFSNFSHAWESPAGLLCYRSLAQVWGFWFRADGAIYLHF